ncbi:MAG: hypothetical protein ACHRXM_38660 [Isosphaerales bacterium]
MQLHSRGPAHRAWSFGGGPLAVIPRGLVVMAQVKQLAEWMAERDVDLAALAGAAGLDRHVVEAVACGRYTPSPSQRQRLSAALGISPEQVAWGHLSQVEHIYGHGPQFGRSP